jgi:hypothetical protein
VTSRSLWMAGLLTAVALLAAALAARAGAAEPKPARAAASQDPAAARGSHAPKVSPYVAANRRRAQAAATAPGARRGHGPAASHAPRKPARRSSGRP